MVRTYTVPCLTLHPAWIARFRTTPAFPQWTPHAQSRTTYVDAWSATGPHIETWIPPWNYISRAGSELGCGSGVRDGVRSARCGAWLTCTPDAGDCQRNVTRCWHRSHDSKSRVVVINTPTAYAVGCRWNCICLWTDCSGIWYNNLQWAEWPKSTDM